MSEPLDPGAGELPRGLLGFRGVLRVWGRVELVVAVAAFCAVVVLNVVQITLRYGFDGSIFWAQEISQLLMLVAYFVGASCVFRSRHYVIVEFLIHRIPPGAQRAAYALAQVLTVTIWLIVLWTALAEASHTLRTYSVILHLPRFYAYLPLMVGAVSVTVTTAYYALAVHVAGRLDPHAPVAALEARVRIA